MNFFFSVQTLYRVFIYVGVYSLVCLVYAGKSSPVLNLDLNINSFICDCKDYDIISVCRFFTHSHWLDELLCEEPPDLVNSRVCWFRFMHCW